MKRRRVLPIPARRITDESTIGLFSPSEPLANDRPARLQASLNEWTGTYHTKYATNARAETFYTAGSVSDRLSDIRELLEDSEVSALYATWGGKSANQLVGGLPYELATQKRKAIGGFSDVCVLLNAISAMTGLITFSGPNVAGKLHETRHARLGMLRGEDVRPFGSLQGSYTIHSGSGYGRLFGGNLSTFVLGVGAHPSVLATDSRVFFWESASEPPQIIDQYLQALANFGFFDSVSAMVVGDVMYEEEERKDRPVDELLASFARTHSVPTLRIPNFGHRMLENPVVPIGAYVKIDADACSAELTHAVVE